MHRRKKRVKVFEKYSGVVSELKVFLNRIFEVNLQFNFRVNIETRRQLESIDVIGIVWLDLFLI